MTVWELMQDLTRCDPEAIVKIGLTGQCMHDDSVATRVLTSQKKVRRKMYQYVHIDDGEVQR